MLTLEVQNLDIISVNLWQIVIAIANLLIIFLILKKFLFGPVKKLMKQRQDNIDNQYAEAQKALNDANAAKKQFEDEISGARTKATEIIKSATDTATARSEEILSNAKEKADGMVTRAKNEIELETKKARQEIKREIAEVSTAIAEKILEREINADDHKDIIDNALKNLGEADE